MSRAVEKVRLRQINGVNVKSIGFYISPRTGKEEERVWALGKDRAEAEAEAMARLAVWHRIRASGRRLWTEADEAAVQTVLQGRLTSFINSAQD